MTEEWVLFWYQCLSENLDYSEYCSAMRDGDFARSQKLESRFPLLPELYGDFGGLFGWPEKGVQGGDWKEWFEPKRHLFLQSVEEVAAGAVPTLVEGHVLLRVPLQVSAEATSALVHDYLNRKYSLESPASAPISKYRLHTRGNRIACGYQQVRQAVHTSTVSYAIDPVTFDYLPIRQVIVNFLRGELDNMGWSISVECRKRLLDHGTLDEDTFENFKVRINKCRRDFMALSQNVIRGRFPDLTPYPDSRVMDQFWGE